VPETYPKRAWFWRAAWAVLLTGLALFIGSAGTCIAFPGWVYALWPKYGYGYEDTLLGGILWITGMIGCGIIPVGLILVWLARAAE
jgi:hypothetical protein